MSDRAKLNPKDFDVPQTKPKPSPSPAPSAWDTVKRIVGAGTGYTVTQRIGKDLTNATKGDDPNKARNMLPNVAKPLRYVK